MSADVVKENLPDGSVMYRHPTLPLSCKSHEDRWGEYVLEFYSKSQKIGEWDGYYFSLEENIFLRSEEMKFCVEMIQFEIDR